MPAIDHADNLNRVRTLLLSLRPRFAHAILTGVKTAELRRRPINAEPGSPVLLYASSPTMAVVGTARLHAIQVLEPDTAWNSFGTRMSLTRIEFDAYLCGSEFAHVLLLKNVVVLEQPLPLDRLRADGNFRPPQSFRYINSSDPAALRELAPA